MNVCQPDTGTQMTSRKKTPTLSSLSTVLADCSAATTASPTANVAARHNRVESGDSGRLSPSATQQTPAASQSNASTAGAGTPSVEPNFLANEVCDMLKIGRTTLYKLVKSGELVPLRVTARIRIWPLSTIEAFLASKGVA
ncbi:helix-turn-helix transcriptional regulator [Burkholderia pseudomallei]|uniref:helix-turn-helix transcriptional regulator n=1 Tax=Burkholderia pseudomallei TaxID=28450 RepID=UPI002180547A|nr:helix-turn-helix domain-containing protein [Burkholderia pseudomallei]